MTPKKKKLLIDMDGVLSDIYAQFIKFESAHLGLTQTLTELKGKSEREAFKFHDTYVNAENFFYSATPIQDSIASVRKLNVVYEVYIVSSAIQFPLSLVEKINWLSKHFPFISWKQIVFCGTKNIVYGDIMIDDHFANLDIFKGQTILFTQPHNIDKHAGNHIRVNNWKEIEMMLL